ncbi:hypothetical protein SVIOM342S_04220 [Streptomyces violaceorubidus]
MQDFDPRARHVLPVPPALSRPTDDGDDWGYTMQPLRIPERRDYDPGVRIQLAGQTYLVLYNDIWAGELGKDKAAALGVAADATLRHMWWCSRTRPRRSPAPPTTCCCGPVFVGLVLIAAIAYCTVRIALRPVEAIRVLTASVTPSDPRQRVTVRLRDTRCSPPWPPPSTPPATPRRRRRPATPLRRGRRPRTAQPLSPPC